ncbi:hypothetical protein [Clostridium sp. CTA-6]
MLTDNDKEIARHIESVGICTAKQIAKIFYKDKSQGQAIARRRLKRLEECGYIKITKLSFLNNTNAYIFNSKEYQNLKPSLHRILLLDYYAELFYHDVNIKYFKKEQNWLSGKIKSDGFFIFDFNGKQYFQIVEVASTNFGHNTIKKYEDLYKSNELQRLFGEFPQIILIDSGDHFKDINSNIKFIHLNHKLNNFVKVFDK